MELMIQIGRFDELGSGVINVHRYLPLYANGATPIFQESEQGFITTLPLADNPAADRETDQVTGQVTDQVNDQVTDQVTDQVGSRILQILTACLEKTQTGSALQAAAGIRNRSFFRINYLSPLLKQNLLERTIPDKPTSRLQKYRLTEKGKKVLASGKPKSTTP